MKVYIDESGDPGTRGAGTRWLLFGAVVLRDNDVEQVSSVLDTVSGLVSDGKRLHFSDMKSHISKKGAYKYLSYMDWTGIVVASDTTMARNDKGLGEPTKAFNYPLRYLLMRISWLAKLRGEVPDIYFDDRHYRFNLPAFKDYMARFRGDGAFEWDYLDMDRFSLAKSDTQPPICLADGLAHAAFNALQPDRHGNHEMSYLDFWKARLWRRPGAITRNGFAMLPLSEAATFKAEYPWLESL